MTSKRSYSVITEQARNRMHDELAASLNDARALNRLHSDLLTLLCNAAEAQHRDTEWLRGLYADCSEALTHLNAQHLATLIALIEQHGIRYDERRIDLGFDTLVVYSGGYKFIIWPSSEGFAIAVEGGGVADDYVHCVTDEETVSFIESLRGPALQAQCAFCGFSYLSAPPNVHEATAAIVAHATDAHPGSTLTRELLLFKMIGITHDSMGTLSIAAVSRSFQESA